MKKLLGICFCRLMIVNQSSWYLKEVELNEKPLQDPIKKMADDHQPCFSILNRFFSLK